MKKRTCLCFVMLVIILFSSGCAYRKVTKHHYTLKGGNELWTATYRVDGKYIFTKEEDGTLQCKNEGETVLELVYHGELEDLTSAKNVEFSYDCNTGGGGKFVSETGYHSRTFTSTSSGSSPLVPGKTVSVSINLDGNVQKFTCKAPEKGKK